MARISDFRQAREYSVRSFGIRRSTAELLHNRFLTHIPWNWLRISYLRALGMQAGDHTYLFGGSEVIAPQNLRVAGNCHIGRLCQIDARGGIDIGRNVVIASHTLLITADHDINDPNFSGRLGQITIADRVWIASRVVVTKGVTIGEGAVVAAGSVVHKDVAPWAVVSGVPARPIGKRNPEQTYEIEYGPQWY